MNDYYDTLGCILRDRLDTDEDPFEKALKPRQGKYRTAADTIERRIPQPQIFNDEPVRVPIPPALAEDFAVLRVLPGVPLEYCKQAWKHLLKKYHPDTGTHNLSEQESAAIVRRINHSFRRIEVWFTAGKVIENTFS